MYQRAGETDRRVGVREKCIGGREKRIGGSACRRIGVRLGKRYDLRVMKIVFRHFEELGHDSQTSIHRFADTRKRFCRHVDPFLPLWLKVKFIHVVFGAIDPAVSKNDLVIHQANFFVTGLAKVHTIRDFLAV
jgi:hypothetical protein